MIPPRVQEYLRTLVNDLNPVQREMVFDPARRITVICGRRVGKTYAVKARNVRRFLLQRKANCLYIALTRQSAEELMWGELKELDAELKLGARFNNTALRMTNPTNGSEITLSGADNRADIDKHRGQKYDEVWIDECKSFPGKLLAELVSQVIEPALMDRKGTLGMTGTPGAVLSGPFYDATRSGSTISRPFRERDDPKWLTEKWAWSLHRWRTQDNVAQPHIWSEALKIKESNGYTDENPIWRREFLGEWTANDADRVYKYKEHDESGGDWNVWDPGPKTADNPFGLPDGHWWRYVYGIDLGAKDPFALNVLAYSDTHRDLLQVHEFAKRGMTVTGIGELLQGLIERTGYPDGIVADLAGNGGLVINELNERFGLSIEAAEKKNKPDSIELTNADFVDGRLKLLRGSETGEQAKALQWDETGMKENKAQRNDLLDALIYARRKALHHYSHEPEVSADVRPRVDIEMEEAEQRAFGKRGEFRSPWDR